MPIQREAHRLHEAATAPTTALREELHWSLYAENKNNRKKGKPGKGHRLEGSNWLRTGRIGYKEATPILYGTNTFAPGPDLNRLFRLSKVLPPGHLALITSMDIEVSWMSKHARIPDMDDLPRQTYRSIFRILHRSFPNLRNLSLFFTMVPHWQHGQRRLPTDEVEELWVRPWEELAASRTWDKLEFGVPGRWVPDFTPRADRQKDVPEGRRFRLVAVGDFDIPWPLGRFYANLDEE
ncbi:hypothetical protein VTN00DRAFT_7868 [Thermoascus crustaceus]|uniref:uncharacterized protein n=1 Tax=Thermoascus crustaceus TaxID=5088 RepID=UPI003743CE35